MHPVTICLLLSVFLIAESCILGGGGGGGCGCGCGCGKRKKRSVDMEEAPVELPFTGLASQGEDMLCNNPTLKKMLTAHMKGNPDDSSKSLMSALEAEEVDHFVVICSEHRFAYAVRYDTVYCGARNSTHYCQAFALRCTAKVISSVLPSNLPASQPSAMHPATLCLLISLVYVVDACPGLFGGGGGGGGCGCGGGGGGGCMPPPPPCGCGGRKKRSADMEEAPQPELPFTGLASQGEDMLCNAPQLKKMMIEYMKGSSDDSAKAVMTALEHENAERYVVVCSEQRFAYAVRYDTAYCGARNGTHYCQAFVL
ncbi:hypothetical protein WR25_05185 isoform A [Diploscapter pachys]|uniref:Ground-like domain-containing protein n=1 Tax=Diploscapter pachys TaxID=2018661 RepID=A0A2A2K6W7_9BILA|nr:hypothetical protein WR25_05185 isoform A [Diploscapter pachys]